MDEVDLAILREMGREQAAGLGNLDPKLSLNEVARRAGLPPSTVSQRVRAWEDDGFLARRSIWPNPHLLGANLAGMSVHAPGLTERPGLVEDLSLVDGVLLVIEHVEPWLALAVAYDADPVLDRRQRLIQRVAGVESVERVFEMRWPCHADEVSPLEWRLIHALFEHPSAQLHRIADVVGVSTRTVTRKLGPLIEGGALWSVFELDFTRWTGTSMVRMLATLQDGADRNRVAKAVRGVLPDLVFINNSVHGPQVGPGRWIDLLTPLPSAAGITDARRSVAGIDGVDSVEVLIPRGIHAFDHWIGPRLGARLEHATR